MHINLNVKIKVGPRTPVEVNVFSTSVNERTVKFTNGKQLTETQIADWIQPELTRVLKERAGEA